jgi:excisionase family DNA binding protein
METGKTGRKLGQPVCVPRRLFRVAEAAFYLGMSKSKIRQLAWNGKLPFVQDGENALMLFDVQDLDRWIDANKEIVR